MPLRPAPIPVKSLSRTFGSLTAAVFACVAPVFALEGKVLLPDGRPAAGATLTVSGQSGSVRTDA